MSDATTNLRARDVGRTSALALVARAPDVFLEDPRPFFERTSRAGRLVVFGLDAVVLRAFVRRVLVTAPAPDAGPLAFVDHAIAHARRAFVNQREVRAEHREGIHEGIFFRTAGARLVRGYTSCEGQNHLLAVLLATRARDVALVETRSARERASTHTLVTLPLGGAPLFADAWGDVARFTLEPLDDAIDAHVALAARGLGEREWLLPVSAYTEGRVVPLRVARALADKTPLPPDTTRAGAEGPADQPGYDAYLRARVEDLFGDRDAARAGYLEVAGRADARPFLRAVSAAFARRLPALKGA